MRAYLNPVVDELEEDRAYLYLARRFEELEGEEKSYVDRLLRE